MAAGPTYTQISSTTVTTNVSGFSIGSFSGYTNLKIVLTWITNGSYANAVLKFNGATSGYEQFYLGTYGTTNPPTYFDTNKYTGLSFAYLNAGYSQNTGSIPGIFEIEIPYYSDTSTYTNMLNTWAYSDGSNVSPRNYGFDIMQTQWRSNAGVSSIEITSDAPITFSAGTVLEVFGIKEA